MATQPSVVAGGMTICTRSPLGNEADNSGEVASMRCCVELATNLANRVHHSKSANGSGSLRQPARVSRNACSGRLMQSSITSAFASSGRRARRLRLSAETSSPALTVGGGLQLIDRSEIQIARDQHLDTVALLFDHRRRNIDGSFEHFGHHALRRRWIDDDRAVAAPGGLHRTLYRAIDHRNQHGRAETLPEMSV